MKPVHRITAIGCLLLILSFRPHKKTIPVEPQGYAILVGVPKVNNNVLRAKYHFPENEGYENLPGAAKDVARMYKILKQEGFKDDNIICIGKDSSNKITKADILSALKKTAAKVKPNDLFVFYYSGHGTTVPDEPNGDEENGEDQALVTYDSYLIDDAIDVIYKKNFSATRNVMLIDACHAGSIFQIYQLQSVATTALKKDKSMEPAHMSEGCDINKRLRPKTGFNMIYYGASREESKGYDTGDGGYFTTAIESIYHPVTWKKTKPENLACTISIKLKNMNDPGEGKIQYTECGNLTNEFKNSHLFKIK